MSRLTELYVDVGNKGSGKTTQLAFFAQYTRQVAPLAPIVLNTPMYFDSAKTKPAILERKIMKWMATKAILKDTRYALVGIDEAALSEDLESRGSFVYSTAPRTYLLALSRKLHCDIRILTQMLCLAGGTMIETPAGMIPIEQIKPGDKVIDRTYWGVRERTVGAVSRQTQPRILVVDLESGHRVAATPEHRFPVYLRQQQKRDVKASELMVGDMLKIDRWRFKRQTDSLCQLLGLLHAEASWRTTQGMRETNQLTIALDKREVELQEFVQRTIRVYRPGAHLGVVKDDGTNRFRFVLSRKGDVQFFRGKYDDFLLSEGHSFREKASFLSGFFEGDGHVGKHSFSTWLSQSETNRDKLEVAEHLLRDLGIPFRVYSSWQKAGGAAAEYAKQDRYLTNQLQIDGAHSGIFAHMIGLISGTKQAKLESLTKNLYARITSITEINEPTEVYDISIEGGAPYFMAQGIRSHNSMIDKRIRWIGDFYTLCKGHYVPETSPPEVDWFEYQIHGPDFERIDTRSLEGDLCRRWLFPRFETEDIPLSDDRIRQFVNFFGIEEKDRKEFEDSMTQARREYEKAKSPEYISELAARVVKNIQETQGEVTQEDRHGYAEKTGLKP